MRDLFEASSAWMSSCGLYSYQLSRVWGDGALACFVMLNPSVADAAFDDPTIRRCRNFAKREDCGGMIVVNLFAWRATDPAALASAVDPVGPENDAALREAVSRGRASGGPVIAAWGGHRMARDRTAAVADICADMLCLGLTKAGAPRHPLSVAGDAVLRPFALQQETGA